MQKNNTTYCSFAAIKEEYPNEWILVGNPKMDGPTLIGGVLLYHCKEKRDLLNGRHKLEGYTSSTWAYTGELHRRRKFWL